jgi:two-component system LytT family response regulator
VSLDEITHLEADSNYTIVHLQNMQKIVVSKSLKEFEEILPSREFMRVHKSAMIHFQYVKEYSGAHGGEIILHDGNSVAISKKYYDQFIEAMKHVSLTFKRYG